MALSRIQVQVVIDKSDIAVCRSLQGRTNATTLVLFDVSHAPGALVFREFCGAIDMKDHRYHGAHHFETNNTGETRTFDGLPGLEVKPTTVPNEASAPPKPVWNVWEGTKAEVNNGV